MIAWGTIINHVRSLHLKFYQNFPYEYQDIELKNQFLFPQPTGDFLEWEPIVDVPEAVELSPIERILLEGPLSPNQAISIKESDLSFVIKQILMLEREWLMKMNLLKPEMQSFLEHSLLRIQNQISGKPLLRVV